MKTNLGVGSLTLQLDCKTVYITRLSLYTLYMWLSTFSFEKWQTRPIKLSMRWCFTVTG